MRNLPVREMAAAAAGMLFVWAWQRRQRPRYLAMNPLPPVTVEMSTVPYFVPLTEGIKARMLSDALTPPNGKGIGWMEVPLFKILPEQMKAEILAERKYRPGSRGRRWTRIG